MPGETALQRAMREADELYGPKREGTTMNHGFIREERQPKQPSFMQGVREAAARLYGPEPIETLKNDHIVVEQPDYDPRSGAHFRR